MADSPEIVHKKSTETIISTISSTTESGQIEDVELVNVEDEEDEYEENNDDITETTELDEDDDPKEQSLLSEEQKLAAEMANSLADLSEEQKDEIFTEDQRQFAIQNLILFSGMLFIIPVALMYSSYQFLFKDKYLMSDSDAALYGGIIGVVAVYAIVCGFIWIAYSEEKELEKRYKALKSQ